jgi:NAD(P)-dependent dehydrogenase (short-subunit alcohol dehydrogenase family)
MSKQVILVTGASSGFALMTAQFLALAGHTVYASMRETRGRNATQVAALASWSAEQKADLRTVELDVQSDASAEAGVAAILADADCLDVIVHNAGHMVFGPAEAFTPCNNMTSTFWAPSGSTGRRCLICAVSIKACWSG